MFTAVPPVSRAVPGTLVGTQVNKCQMNVCVGVLCAGEIHSVPEITPHKELQLCVSSAM